MAYATRRPVLERHPRASWSVVLSVRLTLPKSQQIFKSQAAAGQRVLVDTGPLVALMNKRDRITSDSSNTSSFSKASRRLGQY
jgi:hypothetical protein